MELNGVIRCNIREIVSHTSVTEFLPCLFNVPISVAYFRVSSISTGGDSARRPEDCRTAGYSVHIGWRDMFGTPDNTGAELDPEGETAPISSWLSGPYTKRYVETVDVWRQVTAVSYTNFLLSEIPLGSPLCILFSFNVYMEDPTNKSAKFF